jgi:hypothetical protein
MIVVEVGHAHVITFLPLSCELSVLALSLSVSHHLNVSGPYDFPFVKAFIS